jgi:hypothetical protein
MALGTNSSFAGVAFFCAADSYTRQDDASSVVTLALVFNTAADYDGLRAHVCRGVAARAMLDGSVVVDLFGGSAGTLAYPDRPGGLTAALQRLSVASRTPTGLLKAKAEFVLTS